MTEYLVIALYTDTGQRYATTVEAENTDQAEVKAQLSCMEDNRFDVAAYPHGPLRIAGVVACADHGAELPDVEVVA